MMLFLLMSFKQIYFIFWMFCYNRGQQDFYLRDYKVGSIVVLQTNNVCNVCILPINFSVASRSQICVSKTFYFTDTVSACWLFFSAYIKFISSHIHHSMKCSLFQFMNLGCFGGGSRKVENCQSKASLQ